MMATKLFSKKRTLVALSLLLATIGYCGFALWSLLRSPYAIPRFNRVGPANLTKWEVINKKRTGDIELTVRMPANKLMIGRLFCEVLRTASVFWNPNYGPVVLILDEADRDKRLLSEKSLNALGLQFRFRVVYEKSPKDAQAFSKAAKYVKRTFGYMQQLYSSYLMDLYTNASVIAWIDTDVVFHTLVTERRIMNNGKLVVKGLNTFGKFSWIKGWDEDTRAQIGLPMVSDFMIYFPVYLFPSTIRNCREFITHRFGKRSFEEAFVESVYQGSHVNVSPVSVLLSYAFYFERDRYEWHLDTFGTPLDIYNRRFPSEQYHVLPEETIMEPHVSMHTKGGYKDILEYGFCKLRRILGARSTICGDLGDVHRTLRYYIGCDLYRNHVESWCGDTKLDSCLQIVSDHEREIRRLVKEDLFSLDTRRMEVIERIAKELHGVTCQRFKYETIVKVNSSRSQPWQEQTINDQPSNTGA